MFKGEELKRKENFQPVRFESKHQPNNYLVLGAEAGKVAKSLL